MGTLSTSFEFRRWVLTASLTLLVVSLQVAHAARASNEGGADGSGGGVAVGARMAVPVIPVQVSGTVVAAGDGLLGVHEAHAVAPVSFTLGGDALLIRDGAAAEVDDLRAGDHVRMTVDGRTGRILQLRADPVAAGWRTRLDTLGPLAALALVASLGFLAARRWVPIRPTLRPRPTVGAAVPFHVALTRFGRERPVALRHRDRAWVA